jgi:hypothetical protein
MGKILLVSLFMLSGFANAATVTVTSGMTKSPANFTATDDVVVTGNATFNSGTYNINSLTVNASVTLTAKSNTGTGVGVIINAASFVTVTGTISANGQGYNPGGPGATSNSARGASHGGHGGYTAYESALFNRIPFIYGNAIEPVSLGSTYSTGDPGGGAVKIVAPTMTLSGSITANGTGTYQPGSGGSIYLNVDTLSGVGTLSARGGSSSYAGGSGGGRIAIFSNSTFSGTVNVQGGTGAPSTMFNYDTSGGTGTYIYRSKSAPNDIVCDVPLTSTVGDGVVLTQDFGSTLGSLTLANGCRLAFYGDIVSGGNINVANGSSLQVLTNVTTATASVIYANNVYVDSTSAIRSDGEGYYGGTGPNTVNYAGSYGGLGGDTIMYGYPGNPPSATYGVSAQPTQLGASSHVSAAGGDGRGGGAIKLFVVGALQVDGAISVNGGLPLVTSGAYAGNTGSAGGSLWIHVGSLSGSGSINANGGAAIAGGSVGPGGGGGGRISYTAGTNTFSGTIAAAGGAGAGGGGNGSAGTVVNLSVGASTQLIITTQASDFARRSQAFVTQPVFAAADSNGYMTPFYSTAISVAAYTDASCTTPASGSLTGSLLNQFGTGTGQALTYGSVGSIYLKATSGSLASVCSYVITVSDPASQIVIVDQPPSSATAGTNFNPQPKLEMRDPSNNVDAMYSGSVAIAAYSDATCTTAISGGTLSGTSLLSNGVVTYSGMNFTKSGPLYVKFTASGLTSACTTLVTINVGAINKIAFTTQPSSTGFTATALAQQPVVTGQDAYGNKVTTYTSSITLAAFSTASCTSAAAGFSATTNPLAAVAGDATYAGVKFANAGTFYIKATQGARTTCSTAVVITSLGATKLVFTTQPSAQGAAQTPFAQQPVIAAKDASNVTDTSYSTAVTLQAYTDASCTTLASGSLVSNSNTISSGVVTVTGLRYSIHGSFYIGATSGSLTMACSSLVKNVPGTLFRNY